MKLAWKKPTTVSILLLVIILIGLFLRVYNLGISFYIDESYSIWLAKQTLPQILQALITEQQPPLYFFILHYWAALFGTSEFALRFLSVMSGVLAIPVVYLVGRQLFDEEVGLVGALILSVSALNVAYSQEARMYSLMVLLALLSMYFFIRFLRKNSVALSAAYLLFTTLLLYTHMYGWFIVIAQNICVAALWFLSRERTFKLRHWVILEAILAVLIVPWAGMLIRQISTRATLFPQPLPTVATVIETFIIGYAGTTLLLVLFVGLSLFSFLRLKKARTSPGWQEPLKALASYVWEVRRTDLASVGILIVWIFSVNLLPFLISQFSTPLYPPGRSYRYAVAGSVALYLLVAAGIRNIRWNPAKLAVIALVVVLSAVPFQVYYTSYANGAHYTGNGDFEARDTYSVVNNNAKTGDLVIIFPDFYSLDFAYYNKRADLIVKPTITSGSDFWLANQSNPGTNVNNNASPGTTMNRLKSAAEGYDRVWFVYSTNDPFGEMDKVKDLEKGIVTSFSESYRISYHQSFLGYEVFLFERGTS